MRTTIDIDKPVLDELKRLGQKRKKTIGKLASELLAASLSDLKRREAKSSKRKLQWTSRSMGARIDLEDKEALHAALDE